MLISLEELARKYDIKVTNVLHVGAHLAEEAKEYYNCGNPIVAWVEANPAVIPQIRQNLQPYLKQFVINCLVTDKDDETRWFNVTNYDGMSSSVFEFDRHPMYSPDTVFVDRIDLPTTTIDTLADTYDLAPELLCLDIQGAELLALRGATKTLEKVQWVYTEVSIASVYAGGAQIWELDALLAPTFVRLETELGMHTPAGSSFGTHGDAFYARVPNGD